MSDLPVSEEFVKRQTLRFAFSLPVGCQSVFAGPPDNKSDVEDEISAKDDNKDGERRASDKGSARDHDEEDSADQVVSTPAGSRTSSGVKFR